MKKRANNKSAASGRAKNQQASIVRAADQDIVGLLTVLVQKLTSFEAKIDMLLSRVPALQAAVLQQQPPMVPNPPKQNRENRPMYKAVCADCSRGCEVPFKPREDRPVYCKECFAKRKAGGIFRPQVTVKPKEEPLMNAVPAPKPEAAKPAKPLPKKKPTAKKKKSSRK